MEIIKKHILLDEILSKWQTDLGDDALAYKNHCYRVLNFYAALVPRTPENINKAAIAIAFHDLGIWTHHTLDYLDPSEQMADDYLSHSPYSAWRDEIVAMIANHHKITSYHANPLVEALRKADWLDVSVGILRFGVSKVFVRSVQEYFAEEGFHRRLTEASTQYLKKHPLKPLPMFKW